MAFRLSTESSLSVHDISVESLRPSSDFFINDFYPGRNLAKCGGRL